MSLKNEETTDQRGAESTLVYDSPTASPSLKRARFGNGHVVEKYARVVFNCKSQPGNLVEGILDLSSKNCYSIGRSPGKQLPFSSYCNL